MPDRLNPLFFRSLFFVASLAIVITFAGCAREPDKEFPALTEVTLGTGKDAKTTEVPQEIHERISKEVSELLGFSPDSLKMFGAESLPKTILGRETFATYPEINRLHDLFRALHDPEDEDQYEDSDEFEEIEDLRKQYDAIEELRQSYLHLTWRGRFNADRMKKGREIYAKRCVQCHGFNGDGNGAQAKHLYPRPRDYRKGTFKFISTSTKALHSDLVKTVTRGVTGTSMPSFERLKKGEIEAVVDYVLALTHRGELEEKLTIAIVVEEGLENPKEPANDADEETKLEYQEEVADFELTYLTQKLSVIESVLNNWTWDPEVEGKPLSAVVPLTPQPRFTNQHILKGKIIYEKVGCVGCHDLNGRGLIQGYNKYDDWNILTRAADLTSGIFHGGEEPIDIYRRIYVGIKGTPMPTAMKSKDMQAYLNEDKDAVWNLVAYVMSLSEKRRATKDDVGRFVKGEASRVGKFEIPNMRTVMNPNASAIEEKKEKK